MSSGRTKFDCSIKGIISVVKVLVKVVKKMTHSDIVSNLANLLPTGTFLAFQAVAPLFTNNGHCHNVEKVVTAILVVTFAFISFLLCYTDSVTTSTGKLYYGLVTAKGLYNPQFKGATIVGVKAGFYDANRKYFITIFDTINAILVVVVFGTLVLLTPPVSGCFFPNIPNTIIKSVPILVGILVGFYFSFAPPPRRGVGFAVTGLYETAAEHHDGHDQEMGTPHAAPATKPAKNTKGASTATDPHGPLLQSEQESTTPGNPSKSLINSPA